MTKYTFGENLKYYRNMRKVTQDQLAERLNISKITISYWENAVRYPRLNTVYDIARVLGIDPMLLLDDKNSWQTEN